MKYLMEYEVIPWIRKEFQTSPILHRTVQTFGLAESMLAERISDWESSLPEFIKLAYLPNPESIRLRLSARGENIQELENILDEKIRELYSIIPQYIFGQEDDTLAGNIGKILKEKGLTISTAESCTGGFIAHSITSNPGSSEYFKGSLVAYANDVKTRILGVDMRKIEKFGAVSKEVVEEMAVKARELLGTDYAVATSGIAGPTGGTHSKHVGMVWIAVAGPDSVISKVYNFGNDRARTIIRSSQTALNMLRLILLESKL
jgi:nicotinamide-nucleotide amidase